ncbi:hypothetical protein EJD97_013775 [Solanum chilense]|uniref:Uncharacterized protein n=1 Tax=Solanum chilense TaxID=4083 RepID=A0A6N2AIH6_SOLCI|nr:hypothetical protein EJD97_013775 [Solanum chilense]
MACHARRCPTVCAAKGPCWHVTPNVIRPYVLSKGNHVIKYPMSSDCVLHKGDESIPTTYVVRLCVLSKGNDNIPCSTSSYHICCIRAMMAFDARRRPTIFTVLERRLRVMPDVVRPRLLPYGDDYMPHPMSFDRVCYPRAMMECHA